MITNAQAIRYTNEVIRPQAEKLRAIKAEIDAALTTYNAGLGDVFYNATSEVIDDGRDDEGVSRLTGNDVLLLITQLQTIQTQLNGAGVANVIAKPCVRPLSAA
jgi:hypothetical protein